MIHLEGCVVDAVSTPCQLVGPKDLVKKSQISAYVITVNSFAVVGAVYNTALPPLLKFQGCLGC